jgi:hypothetical protein
MELKYMSCVLRISGEHFDVDGFLKQSCLSPTAVFHKGQRRTGKSNGTTYSASGVNISVSVRDFSDLGGQIEDAIQFLKTNQAELSTVREFSGFEGFELDFPVQGREVFMQSDRFPSELLLLMGELQMTLTISRYPPLVDEV